MGRKLGPLGTLLTWFGDIKVFKWPLFMIYDPGGYAVKGVDVRTAMELLQPGDILIRGYSHYLDGYFLPGYFSHVGLYLGEVTEDDRRLIPDPLPEDAAFVPGKQLVIHAIAEGVQLDDFLQFARCDTLIVLRFPSELRRTCEVPPEVAEKLPLLPDERAIFDELNAGGTVAFEKAFAVIRRSALSLFGAGYDFGFNFSEFSNVSCTELAFYATRCVSPFLGVFPTKHRVLFRDRIGIIPDGFVSSPLSLVWKSPSCDARELEALRKAVPAVLPPAEQSRAA
jgi:hypothetical protein